jgi:hypothetical protein
MPVAMPSLIVFPVPLWRIDMSLHVSKRLKDLSAVAVKIQWIFGYKLLLTSTNVSQRLLGFIWSVGYNSHLDFHLVSSRINSL